MKTRVLTIGLAVMAAVWLGAGAASAQEDPEAEEKPKEKPEAKAEEKPKEKPEAKDEEKPKEKPEAKAEDKKGVTILKRGEKKDESASLFTAIGASPIDREDTALRISVGYPEFHVMYHMPWDTDIELAAGGGIFYGLNAQTVGELTGAIALAEGRWRLYHEEEHSIALVARPNAMLGLDPEAVFGVTFGFPGIVYDYAIKGQHHAVLGFHIPWGVFFSGAGAAARIPFVFQMGMEFAISPGAHVFATSEWGADIWAGDTPLKDDVFSDGAWFFARVLGGVALVL